MVVHAQPVSSASRRNLIAPASPVAVRARPIAAPTGPAVAPAGPPAAPARPAAVPAAAPRYTVLSKSNASDNRRISRESRYISDI